MGLNLFTNRIFMFGVCLQLVLLTTFSLGVSAETSDKNADGFIIEADRVAGTGMNASLIMQETSASSGEPMLRIQYKSATIYGMKLTKRLQTPNGTVSVTLKASGPVEVKGMTVDTSAITFQGACLNAGTLIPEAEMEKVVMVVHYMNAEDSNIDHLALNIISGSAGPDKPGTIKVLKEMGLLPIRQAEKEIDRITSGHLPLTCDQASDQSGLVNKPIGDELTQAGEKLTDVTKPVEEITQPVKDTVGKVTQTLEPITEPLKDTVGKMTKPLNETVGKITKPLKPVLKPVDETIRKVAKPLEPITKTAGNTVGKVLSPVKGAVQPVVEPVKQTAAQPLEIACGKIDEGNGQITKETALVIIDEALKNKQPLNQLCNNDKTASFLQKWEDGLLNVQGGLLDLFGQKSGDDPMKELEAAREKILKEPDGSVIFGP